MGRGIRLKLVLEDNTMKTYESEINARIKLIMRKFQKRFKTIGRGNYRRVFLSKTGRFVFKVPLSSEGILCNGTEGDWKSEEYAKAKLFYMNDIPIVIMEFVRVATTEEIAKELKKNGWIYSIDCQQVGYNRKGKLVAYDFGG